MFCVNDSFVKGDCSLKIYCIESVLFCKKSAR